MTNSLYPVTFSPPVRPQFPSLPLRLPRLTRQGLSRRELRELVAEMLG